MDDYIFLIVAIILSVFGAINNKKKKEKQQALIEDVPQPKRRPSVFEELFEEAFLNNEAEEAPTIKNEPVIEPVTTPPILKKEEVSGFRATPNKIQVKKTSHHRKKKTVKQSLRSDFSLKQAVIYSEILNRKY